MKVYRIHYRDEATSSGGFSWHSSLRDARKAIADYMEANKPPEPTGDLYNDMYMRKEPPDRPTMETIEFISTKAGILSLLNRYAEHPDNG